MSDAKQNEQPGHAEREGKSDAGRNRPTILVVDDDTAVRHFLLEALHFHGYRVIDAAAVEDAEERLQRLEPGAIGLVITDIHLSVDPRGHEGYDLYQRWVAARPALHFLLISGDPDSRSLPAIRSGAVRFLTKPFSIDELLTIVRSLVGS
jgi:DNA-binding NtrC family response regulator